MFLRPRLGSLRFVSISAARRRSAPRRPASLSSASARSGYSSGFSSLHLFQTPSPCLRFLGVWDSRGVAKLVPGSPNVAANARAAFSAHRSSDRRRGGTHVCHTKGGLVRVSRQAPSCESLPRWPDNTFREQRSTPETAPKATTAEVEADLCPEITGLVSVCASNYGRKSHVFIEFQHEAGRDSSNQIHVAKRAGFPACLPPGAGS